MADVSRSVSLSKKLSNAGDLSSKHIYDGVFSAPTATKLNASTFSIRVDDYREIFSPSGVSLGSSIPILDLPAVDRSEFIGRGRSSGFDYAGVFGGLGEDDRVGVPAEVLFRKSEKKSKTDAHPSRSSMQTKIPDSKSQEFPRDSGNIQASKSPTKTRTAGSKRQEFSGSSMDNPTSNQAPKIPTITRTTVSKGQEFCGSSRDNPTSSQASHLPTITRTTVSKSQEFCGSSRDNPTSSQASHIPTITRTTVSKSQEFCGSSRDNPTSSQASNIPTITRTTVSKGQEFCGSSRDNPTSSQASHIPTITRTPVSKSQEFCGSSRDNPTSNQESKIPTITKITASKSQEFSGSSSDNPTSSEVSKSPTKTKMIHSKSQELCGISKDNPSNDEATHQQFDIMKDLNVPHQKIHQSSKDVTVGMTQIAHLHAVPGYTHTFEEVSPERKNSLKKEKCMSMDDSDFSMDVSGGKRQGKHTRAVSDLGTDKQASDHAHTEFGVGECHTFEATHSTREAIRKSQTFSVSPLASSPQSFGSNDYFRRSSSQRSKRSTNNKQSDAAAGSSSPLLELDVNSTAAVSAAALKRAIEEAEAKIRWAKEFLKGQECDGSTKLSFKDILKVKATSENSPLEAEATRLDKYVIEDKLPKQKDHLNITAKSENSNFNQAGGLKLKGDFNFSTTESQLADEAGMLNEKLHAISAQEDTAMRDYAGFRSTYVATTFDETHDSFSREEFVNDALLEEKASSQEVVKSTEKSHKQEGGGEWEAAKHLSQLISGVKNRFVSFISKQADTDKIAVQEDAPSSSESVEQSEGSTCQVQDADAHIKRAADQDHGEKDVQMNYYASSWVGDTVQDSNIGMEIHNPGQNEVEITVALEQGNFEHMTASPGVEMLISRQYDLFEPEQEWAAQESVEDKEELKEEDKEHSREILDDYLTWEHEKDQMDTTECEEHDTAQEATYQSGVYDSKEETNCKHNRETGKEVQVQEPVAKGVERSDECKDGTRRQEEGCSWRETDMPKDSEKKPEDVIMAEETCIDELQERVQAAELFTGEDTNTIEHQDIMSKSTVSVTEVADDTSKHEEKNLEDVQMVEETSTDEIQERLQATELNTREDNKVIEHQDVQSKSTVGVTEVADDTSEHDGKKLEYVQMVEETCTDELQERVQATELNTREENKIIEHQDVQSKSTVSVSEFAEDASEDDEFLVLNINKEACLHDESSQHAQILGSCSGGEEKMEEPDISPFDPKMDSEQSLVFSKNEEACLYDGSSQYAQHLGSSSGEEERIEEPFTGPFDPKMNAEQPLVFSKDKEACLHDESSRYAQHLGSSSGGEEERMEEPATCSFEPKENVEQSICSQIATQPVREDTCEQKLCSFEVADDIVEHDDYFPAMGHVCEHEQSLMRRSEDACGCDDTDQYSQDAEFTTLEKERMEEPTDTTSETKVNLQQPISVHTINDLIRKEMHEQSGCSIYVADETLDHEKKCPPSADVCKKASADVCKKEMHSCLDGDSEGYEHDDGNEHTQDAELSFENESMTESVAVTSAEPEWNAEQPSIVQTVTDLIREDMTEMSVSARTQEEFHIVEETEDTLEALPRTNFEKTQTDVDSEQKHANVESFGTDIGSENLEDDETEVRTDIGEVDMASDQDIKMHDAETSYKRKRWFQNRDEAGESHRSSILLGANITLELDQEKNTQGSKVDDRVEIHVDERVNESGEGTHVRQTDASTSLEGGCHSTEATHRRRRWFENRGQEILHKPQMDSKIAQESELVEKLVNKGKEGTDVREDDVASDQVESRATAEAAHRRRRWFENEEKLGPVQKLSTQEEETEMGADTAKHDELDETSTASIMKNKHQNQLNNRGKEKERERIAVERVIREARQRAFADAKERAAVEARQKAASSSAQDRQGKDSSEAKSGSDKASMDAKLRAERAAVERATAEARERALQRAMSEKAASKPKEKDSKNQTSGTSCSSGYSSVPFATEKSSGVVSESPRRRRAISERNKRTMDRAAKALEEKFMRDSLAQKEQAERNRFADGLDADVKRWLSGKDGNLRAMLSTLQYILGPDSGWQPIPLTDLVTSTAVRKAYKRAALCVHPDKLQQRGATVQQKYICEKVFDLLKDAWHRFNPDD